MIHDQILHWLIRIVVVAVYKFNRCYLMCKFSINKHRLNQNLQYKLNHHSSSQTNMTFQAQFQEAIIKKKLKYFQHGHIINHQDF